MILTVPHSTYVTIEMDLAIEGSIAKKPLGWADSSDCISRQQ